MARQRQDLYDFLKGTDREDRLGPERACAQGWITPEAMRRGIVVTIILACIIGLGAVAMAWSALPWYGLEFVLLGALCVLFAFLYTTRLSYLGLGDLLVLVFFGFVPVCGTYYIMSLTITTASLLLSLISGIAIDALLMINNYRDRDQDRLSGKRTLVVRLGERAGANLYLGIGVAVIALVIALAVVLRSADIILPVTIIYLALHIRTWQQMIQIHHGRQLNAILGQTSRNMFIMALILAWSICCC